MLELVFERHILNEIETTYIGKTLFFPEWLKVYHHKPPVDLVQAIVYSRFDRDGVSDSKGDDMWTPRNMSDIFNIFRTYGMFSDQVLEEYAQDAKTILKTKEQLKQAMKTLTLTKVNKNVKSLTIIEINNFILPILQKGDILKAHTYQWAKTYYKAHLRVLNSKLSEQLYFDILLYLFLMILDYTKHSEPHVGKYPKKEQKQIIYDLALQERLITSIPPEKSPSKDKEMDFISSDKKQNEERLNQMVQKALPLINQIEWIKAREIISKILEEDEYNVDALDILAYIHMEEKRYEEAVKCYQKIRKRQSKRITTLNKLGYSLALAGEHSKAIELLTRAIEYNRLYHKSWLRDLGEIQFHLGKAYGELKMIDEAKRACKIALSVIENHPELIEDDLPGTIQFFCSGGRLRKTQVVNFNKNSHSFRPKPHDPHVVARNNEIRKYLKELSEENK